MDINTQIFLAYVAYKREYAHDMRSFEDFRKAALKLAWIIHTFLNKHPVG